METVYRIRDYWSDGQIAVRRYRIEDVAALYEAVRESIVELTRWGFYSSGFTRENAEHDVLSRVKNWNEGKSFTYLIEMPPGLVFVGNCTVSEFEPEMHEAALGWWVRTSMTRRGIATAAARLVAQAAFEDLHLCSLNIYAKVDNQASRRVAEKIGAVLARIKTEEDGSCTAVYQLRQSAEK